MKRIPGTVTGRWASSRPAFQDLRESPPRNDNDYPLVTTDLAKVEARIIASLTGDSRLMIHGLTLATANGEDVAKIKEQMDYLVKMMTEHTGMPWAWVTLAHMDAQVLAPVE